MASSASAAVEHNMNKELLSLSQHIIPSKEYLKKGTEIATKALDLLKQHGKKSSFAIDRIIFSGSSGKKTTITLSDFDCVVFINHEKPIFETILEEFDDIFTMHGNYNKIKTSRFSIQFTVDGFEFDILPAANFLTGMDIKREDSIDLQVQRTLDKIKLCPGKYRYMYSSSLSEAVIRFFKKQDRFVKEMARIAKFWFKTLHFDGYPSGAKSMIELIAVKAAQKEIASFSTKSYLRCFSTVLSQIDNFDQINIIFEEEYKFPEHKVPERIRSQKPLVLEPANPYNNLAKSWNEQQIIVLKAYAKVTRQRLTDIEKYLFNRGPNIQSLEYLFEPQPKIAPIKKYFQKNFLVGANTDAGIQYPDLKMSYNHSKST